MFLAEHDYSGSVVCWFNNNICSLSEVWEGLSFDGREVAFTSSININFQLAFHILLTFMIYVSRAAFLPFGGIYILGGEIGSELRHHYSLLPCRPYISKKSSFKRKRLK